GMSHERADRWDDNANLFGILGAGGLAYKLGQEAVASFRLPSHFMPNINQANGQILFGQKSVSPFFSELGSFKSRPLSEVVQGLRNGTISPESVPIEIIVRNGQRITLNNRSLLTLRRAGMEPKIIFDKTGIEKYEYILNTHLKGNLPSDVIKIRGGPPGTSLIGPLE
ncbi:MAG TPA: hypothetical protein VKR53_00695, partial [Puia sp.]|nr:hypothetical protein [Puia sp.]